MESDQFQNGEQQHGIAYCLQWGAVKHQNTTMDIQRCHRHSNSLTSLKNEHHSLLFKKIYPLLSSARSCQKHVATW